MKSNSRIASTRLPTQTELLLPLLDTIREHGGAARPGAIYDELAAKLDVDDELRSATTRLKDGQEFSTFERRVRWTRQTAVLKGLLARETRGVWELTDAGNHALRNARRGTIVTVFEGAGGVLIWANAEDVISVVERKSVQALITSPPYPLLRQKQYGNLESRAWLDWMLKLAEGWRELLTDDGSLFLNLGPVWTPGQPTQDLYVERLSLEMCDRLGYHLAQRLEWHSPSRLPQPIEWVCVRRVRLKPTTETVLWFSPSANPKADNRNILVPYSESMKRTLANGQKKATRPSGAWISEAFGIDNGGAIPSNLIVASNAASNDAYHRACRENDFVAHPATFPAALPELAIKLTTDECDVVMDPFAGSGTTCKVAQKLNRRFIGVERSRTYLDSAIARLEAA
jgi:DNA modification methylase